ncbi:hypothetical protein B0T10DRAFT_460039 [Thelonectria olida]|uniref:Uncharacterized protein n=1 Tax=Thelonectria olida TaxID=1576542 RepID=A0A9P9APU9_9HYPO|nr:hypothetical protein B0T10DRAFT_460039 [Thelonectria olida]
MKITHAFVALFLATSAVAKSNFTKLGDISDLLEPCRMKDIEDMNVDFCNCIEKRNRCEPTPCKVCPSLAGGGVLVKKKTTTCFGCKDADLGCKGCNLWFNSVCNCIKNDDQPNACLTSSPIQKKGDPVWVLVEDPKHHNLITPTKPITGIAELNDKRNVALGNLGWNFAQANYKHKTEALAMDSWRTRKQEQVHIHVCNKNTTLEAMLSKEKIPTDGRLFRLQGDPDLSCVVRPNNGLVFDFSSIIDRFSEDEFPFMCNAIVGAGIMSDTRGNTWACATTHKAGPVSKFCAKY